MLAPLITDRKESDIGKNELGSYNISDIQRVNDWTDYLNESINMTFLINNVLQKIGDLNYNTIPTKNLCEIYINNIKSIMNKDTTKYNSTVFYSDFMNYLNIKKANLIEEVLLDIFSNIQYKNNYIYCYDESNPAIDYVQGG